MAPEDDMPLVSDESARVGRAYHGLLRRQQRLARLEELEAPQSIVDGERELLEKAREALVALGWDGGAARIHRTPYDLDRAEPPDAQRVQRRALVLAALSERAKADRGGDEESIASLQTLAEGLDEELEEQERRLLQAPLASLAEPEILNASWLIEGAAVLAWALGRYDPPGFDSMCNPRLVKEALRLGAAEQLAPALRPRVELIVEFERIFAVHWRLADFRLQPAAKSFAQLSERPPFWFGPLATEGTATAPAGDVEDMAIRDRAISLASDDDLGLCESVVLERRRALGWCCGLGERYSDVPLDT